MNTNFFPQRQFPKIYAYSDTRFPGCLKIGKTTRTVLERIQEQFPVKLPAQSFTIELEEEAVREDGTFFIDTDVHHVLDRKHIEKVNGEWYRCTVEDVKAAILELKTGKSNEENRSQNFGLRPEQEQAIEQTAAYFESFKKEFPDKTPHFLWNAKMRFGKTFTSYQLAKKMGWSKILVLTFKPAVEDAWEEDLRSHIDFEGWQFVSRHTAENQVQIIDSSRPIVCFGSFQDYLGTQKDGSIKPKNKWVHQEQWDCVFFDEYHYGAWRKNARDLFGNDEEADEEWKKQQKMEHSGNDEEDNADYLEQSMPIKTNHYVYLSGTPFRAINSGEFIEEQIFNWTYSDEQRAKQNWPGDEESNPYASLPQMIMMTYQLPDSIRQVAAQGEFNEYDLNEFFKATGEEEDAIFKYPDEAQSWLDLIRGAYSETTVDNLKLGAQKPALPFSHRPLLQVLNHTFWFLPSVASCYAMRNLLAERQNTFYQDYEVVVAAGTQAGIGLDALPPVRKAIGKNGTETKSITLSCGKLTTGVSVKQWTGIFMLRNSSSPETYFQAAFRVQTPWTIKNSDRNSPNKEVILKEVCYVFDFAPERALRQISDYSTSLNVNESNPEAKVAEFIHFLPVLAYDGSSMKQIDAAGVLDMAMSGTTATLLARRWESALLVNVDNPTLSRIMNNEEALTALMNIEGFRTLNQDIETIINKSEKVKKAKKEAAENGKELTEKQKKELTEEEKKYKSLRKQIQEKLIKFATRIPVFMYLTDFREYSLKDIITQLEPALFKKVTGLTIRDFELLVSLNVFNSSLMNDAVFKFKRYEDASLEYTGINKHNSDKIGGYDTVVSKNDFRVIINEG